MSPGLRQARTRELSVVEVQDTMQSKCGMYSTCLAQIFNSTIGFRISFSNSLVSDRSIFGLPDIFRIDMNWVGPLLLAGGVASCFSPDRKLILLASSCKWRLMCSGWCHWWYPSQHVRFSLSFSNGGSSASSSLKSTCKVCSVEKLSIKYCLTFSMKFEFILLTFFFSGGFRWSVEKSDGRLLEIKTHNFAFGVTDCQYRHIRIDGMLPGIFSMKSQANQKSWVIRSCTRNANWRACFSNCGFYKYTGTPFWCSIHKYLHKTRECWKLDILRSKMLKQTDFFAGVWNGQFS